MAQSVCHNCGLGHSDDAKYTNHEGEMDFTDFSGDDDNQGGAK